MYTFSCVKLTYSTVQCNIIWYWKICKINCNTSGQNIVFLLTGWFNWHTPHWMVNQLKFSCPNDRVSFFIGLVFLSFFTEKQIKRKKPRDSKLIKLDYIKHDFSHQAWGKSTVLERLRNVTLYMPDGAKSKFFVTKLLFFFHKYLTDNFYTKSFVLAFSVSYS